MNWTDLKKGILDAYREGAEDHRIAYFEGRAEKGLDSTDAPRIDKVLGHNPTFTRVRELLGLADPTDLAVRKDLGMDLRGSREHKVGQVLGTLGADLTEDRSRALWWLINAPQALGNIIHEQAMSGTDLYASDVIKTAEGTPISTANKDIRAAREADILSKDGRVKPGYGRTHEYKDGKKTGRTFYSKRRYSPVTAAAVGIPSGFVINAGMGLMTPLGGMPGYEAVFPSEDDPSKTASVPAEIATKYLLGRTGKLLPYDEFVQHRPDVSKAEYNKYKAYKWDKELDYNPLDDGEVNLLPEGVLKATMDGIHGPEVQFLGRSLPLATTLMPFTTTVAGSVAAAKSASNVPGRSTTRRGFLGGVAGAAAGLTVGHLLEAERQRRNKIENFG